MGKKLIIPFQPLNDFVIVKPDEPAESTKGGIVLPDRVRGRMRDGMNYEPTQLGTVVKLGPGTDKSPAPEGVKAGTRVVYQGGYGEHDALEHDDEKYHVVKFDQILCIVHE